ncbi:probable E3 ubiquitin-protein ligase bre1 [Aplysia californica]|uniref:Probable E3 ubiquitin-protein ligase bre1 n=1 Tax=Aplysia californica TaxID=6500 RepID=A0ABM1A197_APLCA|nr:probable E3 ubiquitin-protein ligase bre1 [Aplysia californica]
MSRAVSRRGRMRPDDEHRLQVNLLYVEREVDGADLAPALFAAKILDLNDKDEVMNGPTPLLRTRRLIGLLMQRGEAAFGEFLQCLDDNGYDHVAFRIRNTSGTSTDTSTASNTNTTASATNNSALDRGVKNSALPRSRSSASVSSNAENTNSNSNDDISSKALGRDPLVTNIAVGASAPTEMEFRSRRLMHTSTGFVTVEESRRILEVGGKSSCHSLPDLVRSTTVPDNVFLTSSLDGRDLPRTGFVADPLNKAFQTTVVEEEPERQPITSNRRRDTRASMASRDGDDDSASVQRSNRSSLTEEDRRGKSLDDRLKKIEESWFILSRRVTRVEDRVTKSTEIPEEELHLLKEELSFLKADTLEQVQDLTLENERKAQIINALTEEVEEKKARLQEAQTRIEALERRIDTLETQKVRSEEDMKALRRRMEEQEEHSAEQSSHFRNEAVHLRNQVLEQEKQLKLQEAKMAEMHDEHYKRFEEQQDELLNQRLQMADQMQQLSILAQTVHNMAQTGSVGQRGPATQHGPASSNQLNFCVSGNTLASSTTNLGANGVNAHHTSARSVKRSAPPPIYRSFRRK